MLVAAMGVAGAISTDYSKDSKEGAVLVTGHLKLDPEGTECESSTECSTNIFNPVCRVGNSPTGAQLWDMNEDQECVIPLYRP